MTEHARIAQEPDALAGRRLAGAAVVVAAATAASLVATAWILGLATRDRPPAPPSASTGRVGPLDVGAIDRQRAGEHANADAAATLAEWRWLDRDHGVARIPIDAAMRAVAEDTP